MKTNICLIMAIVMMHFPFHAFAAEPQGMISTATVVEEMSHAQAQEKIEKILSDSQVRAKLAKLGISQDEISKRLATLSDSEIRKLAKQMEQARYGGDAVIGILVIVVLVLLVIFLIKRI